MAASKDNTFEEVQSGLNYFKELSAIRIKKYSKKTVEKKLAMMDEVFNLVAIIEDSTILLLWKDTLEDLSKLILKSCECDVPSRISKERLQEMDRILRNKKEINEDAVFVSWAQIYAAMFEIHRKVCKNNEGDEGEQLMESSDLVNDNNDESSSVESVESSSDDDTQETEHENSADEFPFPIKKYEDKYLVKRNIFLLKELLNILKNLSSSEIPISTSNAFDKLQKVYPSLRHNQIVRRTSKILKNIENDALPKNCDTKVQSLFWHIYFLLGK